LISIEEVQAAVLARGLSSVWTAAEKLGPEAVRRLAEDIATIDWDLYERQKRALRNQKEIDISHIAAPTLVAPSAVEHEGRDEARAAGEKALREGQVAIITVAGGQASRLGFDGPKGAYPLGAISGASLFQMFAGQIRRLRELYGNGLPWIIQTGPGNHEETIRYFERRSFFGLGSKTVHFVCQGTLPALAPNGELLLAAPDRLFRNPDGHGGVYRALKVSGMIPQLREQGVSTLFYCQVDNPLVWMADSIFLGHHLLQGARMSVKVVEKTEPTEKVGLVVADEGRNRCVEYSDLAEDLQAERVEDGGLRFRAGNIAIHAFQLDFVEEMAEANLQLHLAHKQVLALAPGSMVAEERSGIKFETFVFDALPLADPSFVQLADRQLEFAPVKNRSGVDSISTSKQALAQRNRRWLQEAGVQLLSPKEDGPIELESGLCLQAEDLHGRRKLLTQMCLGRLWKVPR
jgi:UDP-N-acetylglucosamine/UDP-N-acetylgalactosamine diphosphorylase